MKILPRNTRNTRKLTAENTEITENFGPVFAEATPGRQDEQDAQDAAGGASNVPSGLVAFGALTRHFVSG